MPAFSRFMFGPKKLPEGKKGDDSDKYHDMMMAQWAQTGMKVQEHQYNVGWRKFNVDAPPVDTFVAHVDPFDDPNAIRGRYEETANFWDRRIKNGLLDLQQARPMEAMPKRTPIVHAATREIVHPITGKSTGFINFAYMPDAANAAQRKRAEQILASNNLREIYERHTTGYGVFRHAPGQSFRYSDTG